MRAVPSTAPVMTPGPSGEPPVPLDDRAKRPRSAEGSHTGPRTVRIAPTRGGFRRRGTPPPGATGLPLFRQPSSAGSSLSLAAIFTRSASESAPILRITLPRWAFTVISLIPSSPATCLFSRPAITRPKTSAPRRYVTGGRPFHETLVSVGQDGTVDQYHRPIDGFRAPR